MAEAVIIWFQCESRSQGCLMVQHAVEDITMSVIKESLYKRLELDESKVRLKLSFYPPMIGRSAEMTISDDVDLRGYLSYVDERNGRCQLFVEVINTPEEPQVTSRVVKSSVGKNYDGCNDGEIAGNAITVYVEPEIGGDKCVDDVIVSEDASVDRLDLENEFVESGIVIESSQFIEEWDDGLGLSLHQEFQNKKSLQEHVDRGAFGNSFRFHIKKSEPTRLVLECTKEGCSWILRASRIKKTEMFRIRKYTKMHTCSRASQSEISHAKRQGTPELVAALLEEEFPGQLNTPTPRVIMNLVKTKLGVTISYSTARRGKELAISNLRGTPEESYKMLYSYLYMLEKANAGTKTEVKVDADGKFRYLFIALGACIQGFRVMRKVIIVDATFLKNAYGGVLAFAIAQDPNRHIYPLAYGVLDSENDASWTWFLQMLKTVIPDDDDLVFMSDRNPRLLGAVGNVYPKAYHGHCIWHLAQNVKDHVKGSNKRYVAWKFMELSRKYTEAEFNREYELFELRFPSAATYLKDTTVKEKWARCHFPSERYNIDTSNSVESLNSVCNDARKYSLIPMLDTILKTFARWFMERRVETAGGKSFNKLVPFVEKLMNDLWADAEKLIIHRLNTYEFDVVDSTGKTYSVNLELKTLTCTCRVFDVEKFPCLHALAAYIHYTKPEASTGNPIELHQLCSKYFWMELWALAYVRTIYTVADMSQWEVPPEIAAMKIIPPNKSTKKGRRKEKRFASAGEKRRRPTGGQRLEHLLFGEPTI